MPASIGSHSGGHASSSIHSMLLHMSLLLLVSSASAQLPPNIPGSGVAATTLSDLAANLGSGQALLERAASGGGPVIQAVSEARDGLATQMASFGLGSALERPLIQDSNQLLPNGQLLASSRDRVAAATGNTVQFLEDSWGTATERLSTATEQFGKVFTGQRPFVSAMDGASLGSVVEMLEGGARQAGARGLGRRWPSGALSGMSDLFSNSFETLLSPSRGFSSLGLNGLGANLGSLGGNFLGGRIPGMGNLGGFGRREGATAAAVVPMAPAGKTGARHLLQDASPASSGPAVAPSLMDMILAGTARTGQEAGKMSRRPMPMARNIPYGSYPALSSSVGRNLRPFDEASQDDVDNFVKEVQSKMRKSRWLDKMQDMSSQAAAMAEHWNSVNTAWSQDNQEAALAAACASYGLGQVFTDFARPMKDTSPATATMFELYGAYYNNQYINTPRETHDYLDALCCSLLQQDKAKQAGNATQPIKGNMFENYTERNLSKAWTQPKTKAVGGGSADGMKKDEDPARVQAFAAAFTADPAYNTKIEDQLKKGSSSSKDKSKPQSTFSKPQPVPSSSSKNVTQSKDVKKDTEKNGKGGSSRLINRPVERPIERLPEKPKQDETDKETCKKSGAADWIRLVYGPSVFADEVDKMYQAYNKYEDSLQSDPFAQTLANINRPIVSAINSAADVPAAGQRLPAGVMMPKAGSLGDVIANLPVPELSVQNRLPGKVANLVDDTSERPVRNAVNRLNIILP